MQLRYIWKKLRYNFIVEWYSFLYTFRNNRHIVPIVESIDLTIEKIITDKCSVSRYGDGEILLTANSSSIGFQKNNKALADRLVEVLQSQSDNHLVCISDAFQDMDRYNRRAARFWRTHFYLYGYLWDKYLSNDRIYYNTFITRPYMDFKSKEKSEQWFSMLKRIWDKRDVIFIEGDKSRLGVGNDLFDNAHSIRRILCPPRDAFSSYNKILEKALDQNRDSLFLIALGPTATVLAYDLYNNGCQAIDVGHVDIEYEWFKMNAKRKVSLSSKYVNEAMDGRALSDGDDIYRSQVICSIV